MSDLSIVEALRPVQWPSLVLVTGRVTGLMLVGPLWAQTGVPGQVRGALALAIAAALLPGVPAAALPADYAGYPVALMGELLLGVAAGLAGALLLHGVALAGEVIGVQMGLNLGEAFSGMAIGAPGGLGELKGALVLTLFTTFDGHLAMLGALAESFRAVAPGAAFDLAGGSRQLALLGGGAFEIALRCAAPLLAALLVANLGIGLLGRAVPTLGAMNVSLPISIVLGLVVFGAALPFLGAFVATWTGALPDLTRTVLGGFAPAGAR